MCHVASLRKDDRVVTSDVHDLTARLWGACGRSILAPVRELWRIERIARMGNL
jgi:hypothetical protein